MCAVSVAVLCGQIVHLGKDHVQTMEFNEFIAGKLL